MIGKKETDKNVATFDGVVKSLLPEYKCRVELNVKSKKVITAKMSGKIRKNRIRIAVGDTVELQIYADNLQEGVITFRKK